MGKCKNPVDKDKIFGALVTNLFRAFDYLNHELLTAQLRALLLQTRTKLRKSFKGILNNCKLQKKKKLENHSRKVKPPK